MKLHNVTDTAPVPGPTKSQKTATNASPRLIKSEIAIGLKAAATSKTQIGKRCPIAGQHAHSAGESGGESANSKRPRRTN